MNAKAAPRRRAPAPPARRAPQSKARSAPKARRDAREIESAATLGGQALQILSFAKQAGTNGLIDVAASERRAERLAALLRGLAPDLGVLVLPPWDCLPYDHAPPSREAMGRRMGALRRLAHMPDGAVLVTTPDAFLQSVPPREVCRGAAATPALGERFLAEALSASLQRLGYVADERVDEPGEMAFHGQVADVFPAGAEAPAPIEHDGDTVAAIARYDAVTQLTTEVLSRVTFDAASEAVLGEDEETPERFPGLEHWLPQVHGRLETVFDYLPNATVVLEPGTPERCRAAQEQIADAYEARLSFRAEMRRAGARPPLPPERLYLTDEEWQVRLRGRATIELRKPADEDAGAARASRRKPTRGAPSRPSCAKAWTAAAAWSWRAPTRAR